MPTMALLIELGFKTNTDGFCYLRNAIIMKIEHPELRFIPIYSDVGRIYGQGANYQQVERVIRNAIGYACKRGNREKWDYFFPYRHLEKRGCPPDGAFIAQIACILEIWTVCAKEVSLDGAK